MDKKVSYQNIIAYLEAEIKTIITQLKVNQTEQLLQKKLEYDKALIWLRIGELHQIDPKSEFLTLPEQLTSTPSSEFRIIEDHESDEQQYWTEIQMNGKKSRPRPGDVLIIKP